MPGRFDYNGSLTDAQLDDIGWARNRFQKLEEDLAGIPEGRYKSLMWTALEEAAMWANKAITHAD